MRLKRTGNDKKPDGMKWGKKGGCLTSVIQLVSPPRREIFTTSTLHPNALQLAKEIANLKDGILDYASSDGYRLEVALQKNRREGSDLVSQLLLRMKSTDVFRGKFKVSKAFERQTITLAHCLIGGIELFYDHLLQNVVLHEENTEMTIGVIRISGQISRPEIIEKVLNATLEREDPTIGFDYENMYGIFPDLDFKYFYGSFYVLQDTPLETA